MIDRVASLLRIKPPTKEDEGGYLIASGETVPANGSTGYATGCLFLKTNGGDGTALWCNEGDYSSSDFTAVTVSTTGP